MTETTRRDIDILVSPPDVTPRQSVVLNDNTLHIDASRGSANGDGSYERPYASVDSCVSARCSGGGSTGALIRLWQGGSSTSQPYRPSATWRLQPGQTVWGEGWQVQTMPTHHPLYADWLGRGSLIPGSQPWLGVPAGVNALSVGNGAGVLGVGVVPVTPPSTPTPTPTPTP